MKRDKTTFALFFGNRGFFPASLQRAARKEMRAALKKLGHKSKARKLRGCSNWPNVPKQAFDNLVRLGVVLDQVVKEYRMDAAALRCWSEMQQQLGISPCVLLREMGDRGIPVACEVDIGNAVTMYALSLASGGPATCLDWNNNYGEEENKCILFHCGPVPPSMMAGQGTITDHAILANVVGEGCSFGCNQGRIAAAPFTYGSLLTRDGDLSFYLGEGRFTADPIPNEFFGCAGVAEIPKLQKALQTIGYLGHRHHTSVTAGRYAEPVRDALARYLHFEVVGL